MVGIPARLDASLPVLVCPRHDLGDLTATAQTVGWACISPVTFCDTVTAGIPKQGTELRLAWSPTELRVLFHCADENAWATLTERDAPLYKEEVVEVFFDPVGDLESYFEIEVNPLNAVLDVVLRRNRVGYLRNFSWDCQGLRTRVKKTPEAWSAELSIPFAALVADAPHAGVRWRANFARIDRPANAARELTAWSPTCRPSFHTPERFGVLQYA